MKNKRKGDAFADTVTGVFMLSVLALLGYFTIVISGVDLFRGRRQVPVEVAFDRVGGVKEHDSVLYRGTKVGTVEKIALSSSNLVARLSIDDSVVLREGYRVSVQSMSLLGGNHLVLEEGTGAVVPLGSVRLTGVAQTEWMQDFAQVARTLNEATGDGSLKTIVTNLAVMSEKVRVLSERLERGEGLLGQLLAREDGGLAADVRETFAQTRAASADVRKVLADAAAITERLRKGEGTLGRLLSSDETLVKELEGAVAAFHRACVSLDFGEMKGEVKNLVAGANQLVGSLTVVADRLKAGEGTLGKLTADETLYREVNGLVRDIRQIIDNYRDTTPITTFGSLATGAL